MYKINEIFYSLQGEGFYTGTPAVFIRFSGCNLQCPFCDTEHESGEQMTTEEIVKEVIKYPARHVVLTGGEPSLFADLKLVQALHAQRKFIAIETNGTHRLPEGIDWVTFSPKTNFCPNVPVVIDRCNELKMVYQGQDLTSFEHFPADHFFLQPCDYSDKAINAKNLWQTINYCLEHPLWHLSLQIHKLIGVR